MCPRSGALMFAAGLGVDCAACTRNDSCLGNGFFAPVTLLGVCGRGFLPRGGCCGIFLCGGRAPVHIRRISVPSRLPIPLGSAESTVITEKGQPSPQFRWH